MSDRPIQVGDLAVVVRACCKATREEHVGKTGIIGIGSSMHTKCSSCGAEHLGDHFAVNPGFPGTPPYWYKRIPPLEELEGQRTEEKLKEPA